MLRSRPAPRPARVAQLAVGAVLAGVVMGPALAQSLKCTGGSAEEGDSRAAVVFKCGQPTVSDSRCEPIAWVRAPGRSHHSPTQPERYCQTVDEWIYDRGPSNLVATLRFREGKLVAVRFGQGSW